MEELGDGGKPAVCVCMCEQQSVMAHPVVIVFKASRNPVPGERERGGGGNGMMEVRREWDENTREYE